MRDSSSSILNKDLDTGGSFILDQVKGDNFFGLEIGLLLLVVE
jgi:hypothetical protein